MSSTSSSQSRVIVGLSGGVDSAVTAQRLLEQGYAVEALFMKNWDEDDGTEYCTARADLEDALRICDHLDIELHTVNFAAEYWDNVFAHFLTEYKAGRTPNPDVLCNREIKFKVFLEHAETLGADKIATGHYARLDHHNEQTRLLKGVDNNKDQSYFLHAVSQSQLERSLFPLGEIEKPQVRTKAEQLGLHVHNKKDSTGICFIGERRFKDFLETYLPAQPGEIRSIDGDYLGDHSGLMFHTIGQRQGLGIGGINGAAAEPWYVAEKHMESNTLIVVQGNQHPALFKETLVADQVNWINQTPSAAFECTAKTRYRQSDQACQVLPLDDGKIQVAFSEPQRAVTPGQYVVLYESDHCLGGGVIQ